MSDTDFNFNNAPRQQLEVIDAESWERRLEILRERLHGSALELVKTIFPTARIQSNEARIGSVAGEPGESLSISLTGDSAGRWIDHAKPEQRGDLIDLWRLSKGSGDFPQAVKELEAWLGINTKAPRWATQVQQIGEARRIEAQRAPKPDTSLGAPVASYCYNALDGSLLAIIRRYHLTKLDERGKPKKTFRPQTASGEMRMPDPRPLYRLDKIGTASEVILVEGEKCADALERVGIEATTQMGGAGADPAKTDWTPLAGKRVRIWEDNDAAGAGLASRVRPFLEAIGCVVDQIVIPPGKPPKWDAADAVKAGEDVRAILQGPETANSRPTFKFNLTFFNEIPEDHHKNWLVRDIFGENELSIVYGAPGSGKSVLVGDAAAHVAAGLPWFGKTTRQCAVIYVAAERHALVKRRLAAWRKFHHIKDVPMVVLDGTFALATDPSHAEEVMNIAAYVKEQTGHLVGWIIIDTKAQVMGGADENSSKDVSVLNSNIAKLQTIGAHVTVIDHTPQNDPKRMKGNGALAGAADGSFLVQKEGGVRTMTIGSKAPNDGPDDLALAFKLQIMVMGINEEGDETTAPVVQPAEHEKAASEADEPVKSKSVQRLGPIEQAIIDALGRAASTGRGLGFNSLKGMLGIGSNDSSFSRAIGRLQQKELIYKQPDGWILR